MQEDSERPPLKPEILESIQVAQFAVQKRYAVQLSELAENTPMAIHFVGPNPPRQFHGLCSTLRTYAIELFEIEAVKYPMEVALYAWLQKLAQRIEQAIIGHVLKVGFPLTTGCLTYHASEPQMREAIRETLAQKIEGSLIPAPRLPGQDDVRARRDQNMDFIAPLAASRADFELLVEERKRLGSRAAQPKSEAIPEGPRLKPSRRRVIDPILASKGWSVLDWAREAKVAHATAMDYLDGKTTPYPSTRGKLATALGIPIEELP